MKWYLTQLMIFCFCTQSLTTTVNTSTTTDKRTKTIVIDWTGRNADVSKTKEKFLLDVLRPAPGIDLNLFCVFESDPPKRLPEVIDLSLFKEKVRQRVVHIFRNTTPQDTRFITGEAEDYPDATKVYVVQGRYERASTALGISVLDPGNQLTTDVAIILGDSILQGNKKYPTLEEWIHCFANVIAHESAHTMGWKHSKTCLDDGWNLAQEQVEVMRANSGLMWFLWPNEFRVECNTSEGAKWLDKPITEYDIINPHLPFPEDQLFQKPSELPGEHID